MPIIPTPEQARELRELFAGNPIVDELEIELRRQYSITEANAAAMLMRGSVFGLDLTDRERDAVIARFIDPEESR